MELSRAIRHQGDVTGERLTPPARSDELLWQACARGDQQAFSKLYGKQNLMRKPTRDVAPTWSPDGRTIAFGSLRDGNAEVYVVHVDGSGLRNLTRSPWNEGSAAWSPARRK
jgi:hypothetical protein